MNSEIDWVCFRMPAWTVCRHHLLPLPTPIRRCLPAYANSDAGSELSVLFDADVNTATTAVNVRPFNSPMAVTGASAHSEAALPPPSAVEEEPTPLVVSTSEVGSTDTPTMATPTNEVTETELTAGDFYDPIDRPPGEKRGEKRRRPNEQ